MLKMSNNGFQIIGIAILLAFSLAGSTQAGRPCISRSYGQGRMVCVCNETYCDDIDEVQLEPLGSFAIYSSSISGNRFERSVGVFTPSNNGNGLRAGIFPVPSGNNSNGILPLPTPSNDQQPAAGGVEQQKIVKISVNRQARYQKIFGYGGAFTDAAGINIRSLPVGAQENLISSYYGPNGIGFTIGRVPIGGCDFSPRPYTYDDNPGDVNLTKFSLQEEDYKYKIPYVKMAHSVSPNNIRLFASPWTAPPWMKTNNDYKGLGLLKREYYQVWANYFVKFLESYQGEGLNFWGVTTQNEPFDGLVPLFPFNCMGWTATQQRDWIKLNLGPTIRASQFADLKIMILDENTAALPRWAKEILSDPEAAKYVAGVGLHWYSKAMTGYKPIQETQDLFPNVFLFGTEACAGFLPWEREKVIIGSWERGEAYAEDIMKGIQHSVVGWTDWNLALNLVGGPNWAGLSADSAILVNKTSKEFYKQPMYYALGHVAKFLLPNSQVIGINVKYASKEQAEAAEIITVGAERPDGSTSILFLNRNEQDVTVLLSDPDRGSSSVNIPARSMHSLVYN